MSFATRTIAFAAVAAAAACAPMPRHVPGSTDVGGIQPAAAATQGSTAVSRKQLAGKESPSTLIAQDQTRCSVPASKYRDAAIGENVWCDWRSDNRAP